MRTQNQRVLDTLASINRRGYDPYNKADGLGWMYQLKWQDDCRRSEYNANWKLHQERADHYASIGKLAY